MKAKTVTHHETLNLFKSVALKPDDTLKLPKKAQVSPRHAKRVKTIQRDAVN